MVTVSVALSAREERVATIDPNPSGFGSSGVHTISAVGENTLLDGRCFKFVGNAFRREHYPDLRGIVPAAGEIHLGRCAHLSFKSFCRQDLR
jgi:hypothetical protein